MAHRLVWQSDLKSQHRNEIKSLDAATAVQRLLLFVHAIFDLVFRPNPTPNAKWQKNSQFLATILTVKGFGEMGKVESELSLCFTYDNGFFGADPIWLSFISAQPAGFYAIENSIIFGFIS